MLRLLTSVAVTVGVAVATVASSPARADGTPDYTPDPASLRQHHAPQWFEDAKLGFFIHWGAYSVPAWAEPGVPVRRVLTVFSTCIAATVVSAVVAVAAGARVGGGTLLLLTGIVAATAALGMLAYAARRSP